MTWCAFQGTKQRALATFKHLLYLSATDASEKESGLAPLGKAEWWVGGGGPELGCIL